MRHWSLHQINCRWGKCFHQMMHEGLNRGWLVGLEPKKVDQMEYYLEVRQEPGCDPMALQGSQEKREVVADQLLQKGLRVGYSRV